MLRLGCGLAVDSLAAGIGAVVLAWQRDADQPFNVAEITEFLAACDQRDRDAVGAGAREIGRAHV